MEVLDVGQFIARMLDLKILVLKRKKDITSVIEAGFQDDH